MSKFWATDSSSSSDSSEDIENANEAFSSTASDSSTTSDGCDPSDADQCWDVIQNQQIFEQIPYSTTSVKDPDCVRFVCISDTHGKHREVVLPQGQVLLHGGDFTKSGETGSITDLSAYFEESEFSEIICIAGNHDLPLHPEFYKENWKRFHRQPFDVEEAQAALKNCTYLNDSNCVTNDGIEVYGSPWSPFFFDWAFNLDRGQPIREVWEKIPSSSDILITHGPPLGRGDLTCNNVRAGCYDLLLEVQKRVKPRVHLFGHIHEGAGVTYDGVTLYINASNLNLSYKAVNFPIVVDVPIEKTKQARIVRPDCKMEPSDFQEWCKQKQYDKLVEQMEANDVTSLPHGNDFFNEDSFEQIANALNLHREQDACMELRRALANLYAESF